ncbi:unnamed protein product [Cylicocyclus nassatus]|uniref:Uncharacterized protein n=1 Tax=Cylicocyclus nassatus TaxID=53992 RepID=A0AA36GZZ9_CYLNA|nr:unnamed protein product [Cylicocyclus nassatus]
MSLPSSVDWRNAWSSSFHEVYNPKSEDVLVCIDGNMLRSFYSLWLFEYERLQRTFGSHANQDISGKKTQISDISVLSQIF